MNYQIFPNPRPDKLRRKKLLEASIENESLNVETPTQFNRLDEVAKIFQRQLPRMPKEYIFRQVFDPKHKTFCLSLNKKIIGGICYRPFYKNNFVEIVFCAVEADVQVMGHGAVMMDFFKEHVKSEAWLSDLDEDHKRVKKSTGPISITERNSYTEASKLVGKNTTAALEFLGQNIQTFMQKTKDYFNACYSIRSAPLFLMTYADNYAIGYFKKNGFSTELTTDCWVGFIKDYDGGTIMQSRLYHEINYLKKDEFILKKREELFAELSKISSFNKLWGPVDLKAISDPFEIPGMKEAKLTSDMIKKSTREENIFYVLEFLLSDLHNHASAWPFLKAVNQVDVPDYYNIIKHPMDLSMIENKLKDYKTVDEFSMDVDLMLRNCFMYNAPGTQYHKCALIIEEFFTTRKGIFERYKTIQ